MPGTGSRYHFELQGENYRQRFLVETGERFADYTEEERVDRLLDIMEDHLTLLSDGRATDRPTFVERTYAEPPDDRHQMVLEEIKFWPLSLQT